MWYDLGMMTLLIILVALWIYLCLIPFNILDKYEMENASRQEKYMRNFNKNDY